MAQIYRSAGKRRGIAFSLCLSLAACATGGSAADQQTDDMGNLALDPGGIVFGSLDAPGAKRVFDGHPASNDSYPAVGQVFILDRDYTDPRFNLSSACTGTLIPGFGRRQAAAGRHLLITAGHCMVDPNSGQQAANARVIFALAPNSGHSGWIVYHATRISARFDWPSGTDAPTQDIALVDVEAVDDGGYTPPMDALYNRSDLATLRPGALVYTVGFGAQSAGQTFDEITNNRLRGAYLSVAGASGRFFELLDVDGGTCRGDSGGPVYVRTRGGGRRMAALTSTAPDIACGVKSAQPANFSRAAPYLYGF